MESLFFGILEGQSLISQRTIVTITRIRKIIFVDWGTDIIYLHPKKSFGNSNLICSSPDPTLALFFFKARLSDFFPLIEYAKDHQQLALSQNNGINVNIKIFFLNAEEPL